MARSEAADKAVEVKEVTERIHKALLRAHRRIFRTAVRAQHDIGTGHPRADDERETSLGQRLYTDSYRDLVVLGFWHAAMKSPKYVCSTSGANIVRAVRKVAPRAVELANSWRSKDRAGVYQEFLREARKLERDVQELDPESRQMTDRHERDMLRMRRTLGTAFHVSEAEARMASYLMRHDVSEIVHVYGTDSPCGFCSRTYAELAPAAARLTRRGGPAGKNQMPAGFRWRIGWIFYGRLYDAVNPEKATDLRVLEAAVKAGSIAGFDQV